ncbi:MAG: nucleotidyltransferase family protein [Paracoccaceae bacterium]
MTNEITRDRVAILLLAAGSSSRMRGRDKLLEDVDGQPLLTRMVSRAMETGMPVFVTVPRASHPRANAAHGANVLAVQDAESGMAASIRAGIAKMPPNVQAVMIVPSDMPDLETSDFIILFKAMGGSTGIIRASDSQGIPGHPVLFPRRYFAELQALTGDNGGREVLRRHADHVITVPLSGTRALTDLDTPEAWEQWRRARSR